MELSLDAPSGIVTLVFTDIEGSSELAEQYGLAFEPIRATHFRLLRDAARRWQGYEVGTAGDSLFLAFADSANAVRWAVDAQLALHQQAWQVEPGAGGNPAPVQLRVRIGMHTGEPYLGEETGRPNYHGAVPNRAARVEAAGHGGQILVSDATRMGAASGLLPDIDFRDCGRHRLKGVGEERIWQITHPALPREFPPLRTLDALRHNLPIPATSLVGREQEIASWRELLRLPLNRLLTLLGFGGMGKTRSALHLAELCADDFPAGVWWAPLEEARTGPDAVQDLARSVGLDLQPQPSAQEQLMAFLSGQKCVLFLDNVEQINGVDRLVHELLGRCPSLKCVATSRRALGLQAERVVEVPPMPPADAAVLFADRARAVRPDFDITPENAADVTELCRRVEGVPLAIELAASRIVGMTPREILSRLTERFRVLQTRAPDLPPRQRALRGAIDWSYDILNEDDQSLFSQLSVFAGGFTLEEAEAVCEAFDVFEGVMELRKNSLLLSETTDSGQQTRYRMLESLRDYAAEKLQGFPDLAARAREQHVRYFLKFAGDRLPRMRTREEPQALEELAAESDNLEAALDRALEIRQPEPAGQLALALYHLLYRRGSWQEARSLLERAAEASGSLSGAGRAVHASVLHSLASIARDLGDAESAQEGALLSLAIRRELGDPADIADALNLLGVLSSDAGDLEAARRNFDESLGLYPASHAGGRGMVLQNLAELASRDHDYTRARQLYEEALTCRRAAGDARGEAETLGNLGALAYQSGAYEEARRRYQESLAISAALHEQYAAAIMLFNLGELAADQDQDLERGVLLYAQAERILHNLGSAVEAAASEALQGLEDRMEKSLFEEASRAARSASPEEVIQELLQRSSQGTVENNR